MEAFKFMTLKILAKHFYGYFSTMKGDYVKTN